MSINTIISCNWPSAKALVENIHADKLNVTDVVARCANVCELAFESKRNEMLGEGIMISLLIQVALSSIFGVLLPGIIWLLNKRSTANVSLLTILLRKIQTLLSETSGFLIISLFIAVISNYNQASNPSITDLTFISRLLDFQFWYILAMIMSQNADRSMNQNQVGRHWQLYYHVLFIAQLATSRYIKIPNQSVSKTLAKECHKQHQFTDVISLASDGGKTLKYMGIGLVISICLIGVMVLGIAYSSYIPPLLVRPWKMLWSRVPSWLKNNASIISDFLSLATFATTIPLNFQQLVKVRKLVIQASGNQLAGEENWGYGQTTAILLWLPFFLSATKETIQYMRNRHRSQIPQAETESLEQEKSPPSPVTDATPPPYDYRHLASISTATPKNADEE